MFTTDPIADMLTRIRNSILVNRNQVEVPYSKLKEELAQQLVEAKYLDEVSIEGEGKLKIIHIVINQPQSNTRITSIDRISKPGRRIYSKADEIPYIKNGRGMVILSTSKGIMTDRQARQQNIGGELLCKVY